MSINHITKGLYIGDGRAPFENPNQDTIVLTVCRDSNPHTNFHKPLYDGSVPGGDSAEASQRGIFRDAVEIVLAALRENKRILVHCQAGISRSSTVLITALAIHNDITYEEAYNIVKNAKNTINPAPSLRTMAKEELDSRRKAY